MSRVQDLTVGGLEEHVLLRVPPELSERVQEVVNRPDGEGEKIVIEAESAEKPRELVFKIGDDAYYATLRDLPTVVETEKTKDYYVYYKSADVAQVVEVHEVKVGTRPRPEVQPLMDDGLTPPMKQARSQRFSRMDRTVKNGLPDNDDERKHLVGRMDQHLHKIVNKLSEEKTTVLQYDELVDMEPFMQYWDERTIIKQGEDNFLTDSRLAYDLAYENYLKYLGKIGIAPAEALRAANEASGAPGGTSSSSGTSSAAGGSGAGRAATSSTARSERPAIMLMNASDFPANSGPGKKGGDSKKKPAAAAAAARSSKPAGFSGPPPPPPPSMPSTAPRPASMPSPATASSTPPGPPPPPPPPKPPLAQAALPPKPAAPASSPPGWQGTQPSPSPPGAPGSSSTSSSSSMSTSTGSTGGPALSPAAPSSSPQASPSPAAMPSASPEPMPSASPGLTPGLTPGGTPSGPIPSPPPGGADEDPASQEIRKLEHDVRKAKQVLDIATHKVQKQKNLALRQRYQGQQRKAQEIYLRAKASLQAARDKLGS